MDLIQSKLGVIQHPVGSTLIFNNRTDPNTVTNANGTRIYPGSWARVPEGYVIYSGTPLGSGDFAVDDNASAFKFYGTNSKTVPLVNHYHTYLHAHMQPTFTTPAGQYTGAKDTQYFEVAANITDSLMWSAYGYCGSKWWDYRSLGVVHTPGASADTFDTPCTSYDIPAASPRLKDKDSPLAPGDRLVYVDTYKNEANRANINSDQASKGYVGSAPVTASGDAITTGATLDVRQRGIVFVVWIRTA
jgi:hypothetical protein